MGRADEREPLIQQPRDFYRRISRAAAVITSPEAPVNSGCCEDAIDLVGVLETLGAPDQLLMVCGDFYTRFDAIVAVVTVLPPTAVSPVHPLR